MKLFSSKAIAFLMAMLFLSLPAIGTPGLQVERLSIVNLIATPERYDGKMVGVHGVLKAKHEENAIYLTIDDARNGVWKNGIAVSVEKIAPQLLKCLDGKYVYLVGTFKETDADVELDWSGQIADVQEVFNRQCDDNKRIGVK